MVIIGRKLHSTLLNANYGALVMASDRVQHFYWKYLDPLPEHDKYGDAAIIYERLDKS